MLNALADASGSEGALTNNVGAAMTMVAQGSC
jgi:hypothetical protein